jgi:hypothetical protein
MARIDMSGKVVEACYACNQSPKFRVTREPYRYADALIVRTNDMSHFAFKVCEKG